MYLKIVYYKLSRSCQSLVTKIISTAYFLTMANQDAHLIEVYLLCQLL